MSARAQRRSFATPFVLIAAVPACVTSNPPRPTPVTDQATHEHREPHTNPPGPTETPAQPDMTPVANPPRPDIAQTEPTPGPAPARGYRQWTVTRDGKNCESMVKVHCPEGAMCNPPPPAKYVCPKDLEDKGKLDIIQHADKGDCFVDFGEVTCPPNASCNPPRPQKVACPK